MNEQESTPETLTSYAERVRRHTNDCHQGELRSYVHHRFGVEEDDIAGVELSGLEPTGATLWWVDSSGARTGDIAFPRTAECITQLALSLREELHAD
jgi:hypothetical protein